MSALFCFISDTAKVTRESSLLEEDARPSGLHADAMCLIPLGYQATISFH